SFSNSRTILANFLLGLRIVPEVVGTKRRLRARWAVAILGPAIALAIAVLSLQAHARHPTIGTPSEATAAAAMFALPDAGVPEDVVGTQTQNAFMRGDGDRTGSADQRNAPHVLGLGAVQLLAAEMSAALQAQAAAASERARTEGRRIEQPLTAKGVSFGSLIADP